MKKIKISPSMMCANLMELPEILGLFAENEVDYLHIDVMDGHYVPNFTVGPDFCRTLSVNSKIPLDIHLMIENVDQYIPAFAGFENAVVCFHPEVSYHPLRTIQLIRSCGAKAGIALDPAMSLEMVKGLLPSVDMVCVMTVNPGYAGQSLVPQGMKLIADVSEYCRKNGLSPEIEVDGNVSWENIPRMVEAGADVLVAGTSSVFSKDAGLSENLKRMRELLSNLEK